MASFTDKLGRSWVIDLTAGDLRRVRTRAGIELGKLLAQPDQLAAVLFGDVETFGRALWALLENQAGERGVTEDDFADGFDRAAVSAAALAVVDAVADFTQPPATAATTKEVVRGLIPTADGAMAAEVRKLTSNGSAGNSPGSPAWTPPPARSAN